MASEPEVIVTTVLENYKVIRIRLSTTIKTTEDVCIAVCKQLGIGPIARHLFSLCDKSGYFLKASYVITEKDITYKFRLRFKVANIAKIRKLDANAYNYYFQQVRIDVLDNKISDLSYERHKSELIGLGIADMYRVMLEKGLSRENVESDYKKFIPREVLKRHWFMIKKPIHDNLEKLEKSRHDAKYVKSEYLRQLELIAPEYLNEVYKGMTDEDGLIIPVHLKISPYHSLEPGLKYTSDIKKNEWVWICSIEDLGFISIRDDDSTVEISRKNGIPFYLRFGSLREMFSFISCLDGYYRLTCKWTFNICQSVPTPSIQNLYSIKCHGPVGIEFSYAKLEEKKGNKTGSFILRECETNYDCYYIDVCVKKSSKPKTFKLEKINNEFVFNDCTKFKSIENFIAAYNDPNEFIYLKECLPPYEYDLSQLLLCSSESLNGDSLTDSTAINTIIPAHPLCINSKDLQIYIAQKKEGLRQITGVYRSMWKLTKGKKLEVAMKILNDTKTNNLHLKEFVEIAGQYAFLRSSAIVRFFGITLTSGVSLILEYFRLGPLDQYLRNNKGIIKQVDLIEAATNLATALWHLKENNIIHGKIRCRKLMVNTHDDNSFTIKLTDPGVHTDYTLKELPWIPLECYTNLEFAKHSHAADVWAFATTLYEIFSFASDITVNDYVEQLKSYRRKRLPKPDGCEPVIYQLMLDCWNPDPDRRKQPQEIMRDINQILYQTYNSRRTHSYERILPKPNLQSIGSSNSTNSLYSTITETTQYNEELSEDDNTSFRYSASYKDSLNIDDLISTDFSFPNCTSPLSSIYALQSIFELDDNSNVVQQGRIGHGFYGEVFQGTLDYPGNCEIKPRKVAIKKLKATALSSSLQDFEREINIMKSLQHPNIVEILGVLREPEILLVMEYVEHKSLPIYFKIYQTKIDLKQLLKFAIGIAEGMEYLGQKCIVHRDLAARNILVANDEHVKISDFGLAQVMGSNDYYILQTIRELPIKWYAPESLRNGKFSTRSDVWSFGVTMWEMFSWGEEPNLIKFNEENMEGNEHQILLETLEKGVRLPCPTRCTQSIYTRIIWPCWQYDPHARLTFAKLSLETKDLLNNQF